MNLGSIFKRHARFRPENPAVVFQDRRLNYRQFNAEINRTANAMRSMGVGKGTKVATVLPNCLKLLEVYWAVAKIGAMYQKTTSLRLKLLENFRQSHAAKSRQPRNSRQRVCFPHAAPDFKKWS